jgi:hypothetical protein
MKAIDTPTTRRLLYGPMQVGPALAVSIEPDEPRLALYEAAGIYYSAQPTNLLQFTAHSERDREILRRNLVRDTLPGRLGSQARYAATLAGIRALLDELAWTLTEDEQRLIDGLEAYGQDGRSRQAA